MGKTGNNSEDLNEIKRTNAFEFNKGEAFKAAELNEDKNIVLPVMEGNTDNAKEEIKRSKLQESKKLKELKENAGTLPYYVPDKKAGTKPVSRERVSAKKQEPVQINKTAEEVAKEMESLHTTLESEERKVFGEDRLDEINRMRYADLNDSKKNKRVNAAMNRLQNAARITEAEKRIGEMNWEQYPIEKEQCIKEIRGFMIITDKPFWMDTDKNFVHNLEKNYELCQTAFRMKKWVSDAVEGGYFPSDISLSAVETKIAALLEVKEYLDVQKELMKNPYYQYMAKEDVRYTDTQIQEFKNRTGNNQLREYLTNVQKLRKLSFVRKKGMDSVSKKAAAEGKRQAKILRARHAKRLLVKTFSEEALDIRGNERFRDKNYDKNFTPEAFEQALAYFRNLKFTDIHFKNIKDIADHFKENARLFDETREFEHLLFVAVQRNLAPADDEMIKLRAKIKAFKNAEYMMNHIQMTVIKNTDRFVKEKTEEEFLEDCRTFVKGAVAQDETYGIPVPGMDMDSYYKSVLQAVKTEHNERAKAIRLSYGLLHPVRNPDFDEDDDDEEQSKFKLGEIPGEELERRKADYEKNAFINDYIADVENYTAIGYGSRAQSFAAVYGNRKGEKDFVISDRLLTRYTVGMSSKELKAVLDTVTFGTEQQKKEFWMKVAEETIAHNLTELDSEDPKVLMNNFAYKSRIAGLLSNLGGDRSPIYPYVEDEKLRNEIEAIYDAGCGHASKYAAFSQAMKYKWFKSVPIADWFSIDVDLVKEYSSEISNKYGEEAEYRVIIDGKAITKNKPESDGLCRSLDRPHFVRDSHKPEKNPDRKNAGYVNTASISIYEARKYYGLAKNTTNEELEELRAFYGKNYNSAGMPGDIPGNLTPQDKLLALEDKFKAIMTFDLSLFTYRSYKDIEDAAGKDNVRFRKCIEISRLAEKIPEYIEQYNNQKTGHILNGVLKASLSEEHLKEVTSRAAVIKQGGALFGNEFLHILESPALAGTGLSLDEIMHLSEAEIDALKKAAPDDADRANLCDNVLAVIRKLQGFDLRLELGNFIPARRFENGCLGESAEKEIVNILSDKQSVLSGVEIGNTTFNHESEEDFLGQFVKAFDEQKLTVSERERKMTDPDSRLYRKKLNAQTLKTERQAAMDFRIAARRKINYRVRMEVGEEAFMHLSAFMTGNKESDERLLLEYADEKTRASVLDRLTKIMVSGENRFDIYNDQEFVFRTKTLEKLSARARAFNALLKANPDYADRLRVRRNPDYNSDYTTVMEMLDEQLAISDYYRARALLITDSYYISHYNHELSYNHGDKASSNQRHVSGLIRLTAETVARLDNGKLLKRYDAGMEDVLDEMEKKSASRPYLFGQADLKKADISYTAQADSEIRSYFEKVLEPLNTTLEIGDSDLIKTITESNEEHPFPEAVGYETEAVRQHLAMIRNEGRLGGADSDLKKTLFDGRQKKMYNALAKILKIRDFKLEDPETKEVLKFNTTPQRIVNSLVVNYGADLPVEEVLEIAEGFTVIQKEKLDVNNKAEFAYAKKRWLDSAKKLFYLEYNAVKRFENTYGKLPEQLPAGSFLHSLGASKPILNQRLCFGQDVAEISEYKSCKVGDEKISMGEYLARNGLIGEDELSDCIILNGGFYNTLCGMYTGYPNAVASFGDDRSKVFFYTYDCMVQQNETRSKYVINGPRLSPGEERKVWQDALSGGTHSLYGGEEITGYKKKALDLYSDSERSELKQKRKNEAELIKLYDDTVKEREEELINLIKQKMGEEADEELLKTLIVFHPAMMTGVEADEIPEEDTLDFISLVEDFAGKDVPEEEKKAKRTEAYQKMVAQMKAVMGIVLHVNCPEKFGAEETLIDDRTYQDRNVKIYYESRLMRTTVMERISNTLQSLMRSEKDKSVILKKTYEDFREGQKILLSNSILKAMKTSRQYLLLRDIGNREDSVPSIELATVERILSDMSVAASIDLDGGKLSDHRRRLLKRLYGIEVLKTSEILGTMEEKSTDPGAEKKQEEKRAQKDNNIEINRIQEEIPQQPDPNLPALPDYKIGVDLSTDDYEQQETNNCWACAGALLYNTFVGVHKDEAGAINQHNVREYNPSDEEIKPYNEVAAMDHTIQKEDYDLHVRDIRGYMGKGKTKVGSIYEAADFFIKKNRNMAVRRMTLALPPIMKEIIEHEEHILIDKTADEQRNDRILYQNQKKAFLDQVNDVLRTGNPVALLNKSTSHYVTITKINGEYLTVLDSAGLKEETKHIDTFLNRTNKGNVIEITWFSNMKTPAEEMQKQPNLKYDEKDGFGIIKPTPENANNPMWKEGFAVSNEDKALSIIRSVYIPYKNPVLAGGAVNIVQEAQIDNIVEEIPKVEQVLKEEKKDLQPKIYQPEGTVSTEVFDLMEAREGLKHIDALFGGGDGSLDSKFCDEYAALMNSIMESDDITFDEEWITKNADKSVAADLTKLFKLVSNGVIGEDTTKLFLNPAAMTYRITGKKSFETGLYKKFATYTDGQKPDKKAEAEYRNSVVDFTEYYLDYAGSTDIQNIQGGHINKDTKENLDLLRNVKQFASAMGSISMSWNQYIARLLILSAYIARHRLGRTEQDKSVSEDKEVKREMKQVFQEFLIISGIDPETVMLEKNKKAVKILAEK